MSIVSFKRAPSAELAPEAVPGAAPSSIGLGVLLGEVDGRFRARVGVTEHVVEADPSVDPELLREAIVSGARVVLEPTPAGGLLAVGVLATARALTVDRSGAVIAKVRRLALTATEEALLAGPGAFVRMKAGDVELYGRRVISRARELCRVLGRMVKIN